MIGVNKTDFNLIKKNVKNIYFFLNFIKMYIYKLLYQLFAPLHMLSTQIKIIVIHSLPTTETDVLIL